MFQLLANRWQAGFQVLVLSYYLYKCAFHFLLILVLGIIPYKRRRLDQKVGFRTGDKVLTSTYIFVTFNFVNFHLCYPRIIISEGCKYSNFSIKAKWYTLNSV